MIYETRSFADEAMSIHDGVLAYTTARQFSTLQNLKALEALHIPRGRAQRLVRWRETPGVKEDKGGSVSPSL